MGEKMVPYDTGFHLEDRGDNGEKRRKMANKGANPWFWHGNS